MQLPLLSPHHASPLTKITSFFFISQLFRSLQACPHDLWQTAAQLFLETLQSCNALMKITFSYVNEAFSCPEVTQRLCDLTDYYIC